MGEKETNENVAQKDGVAQIKVGSSAMPTFEEQYKSSMSAPMSSNEEALQRKRQRRQQTMAAIIDGLSAIGNVWFASQGAKATGTTNLSGASQSKWKSHWDKVRKERDEYNRGLLQARQLDYNAKLRQLERSEDKAERDAQRAAEKSRYDAELAYRKEKDAQVQDNWLKQFAHEQAKTTFAQDMQNKQLEIERGRLDLATQQQNALTEYSAWDKDGKEHKFHDKDAAIEFAKRNGTYQVEDLSKEEVVVDPSDLLSNGLPKTKTTKTQQIYAIDPKHKPEKQQGPYATGLGNSSGGEGNMYDIYKRKK
jgi:hypothetical protein